MLTINWFRLICIIKCLIITVNLIQGAPIDITETSALSVTQNDTHTSVSNNDGPVTTEYPSEKGTENPVENQTVKDLYYNDETVVITTLLPVDGNGELIQQEVTTPVTVRVKIEQTTDDHVLVETTSENVNSQGATENSPKLGEEIPIEKQNVNEVTTTQSVDIENNAELQSENDTKIIDSTTEYENSQNVQNNATNNNNENPQINQNIETAKNVEQEEDINVIPLLGEASEIVQSQLTNENTQNTLIAEQGDISEESATKIVKDNENDHNQLTNKSNQLSQNSLINEQTTTTAASVESQDQIIENSTSFIPNAQYINDNTLAEPMAAKLDNIQEGDAVIGTLVSELPAITTANSDTATENTQNGTSDISNEKSSTTSLYTSESVIDHTDAPITTENLQIDVLNPTTQKNEYESHKTHDENLSNLEFSSTTPMTENHSQIATGNLLNIETSSTTLTSDDDPQIASGNLPNNETPSTTERSEDDQQIATGNLPNNETPSTTQRSEDDPLVTTGNLPTIETSFTNQKIEDSPQVNTENPKNIQVLSIAQNSEEYGEATAETKEQTQVEHLDTDNQNSSEYPKSITNTEEAASESTTNETVLPVMENQNLALEAELLDHQLTSRHNHNSDIISLADNKELITSDDTQLIPNVALVDTIAQTLEGNTTETNSNMEINTSSSTSPDTLSTTDSPQQTSENTVSEAGNEELVTPTESTVNSSENQGKEIEYIVNTTDTTEGALKDDTSTTTTQENTNTNSDTSLENPGFLTLSENIDVTMGNIQTTNFDSDEPETTNSTDSNDSSEVPQEQVKLTVNPLTLNEEANTEVINTTTYDNLPSSTEPAVITTNESIPKSSEEPTTETINTTTYENLVDSTETANPTSEYSTPIPKLAEEPLISAGTKFVESTEENFAKNLQKAFANLLESDESEENIDSTTLIPNQEETTQADEIKTSATITDSTPQEQPVTLNQDRGNNMAATTNKQFASLLAETEMNVHKAFETLREWIANSKTMEMATNNPAQTEEAATEKPDSDVASASLNNYTTTMEPEEIHTTQGDLETLTNVEVKEAAEVGREGYFKDIFTTKNTQEAQPTTYSPTMATMTPPHVDSFSYSEAKYAPYQAKEITATNYVNKKETTITTQDIKSIDVSEQTTQTDADHTTIEPALARVQLHKDLTGINLTYLEDSSEEVVGNETHNKTRDQVQNKSEELSSEVIAKPTQQSFYQEMVKFIEHDRTTPKVETQTQLPLTQASFLDEQQQQIETTTYRGNEVEHTTTVASKNDEAFATTTNEEQATTIEITTNPMTTTTVADMTTTNIPETTTSEEETTTNEAETTTTTTEEAEIDTTTLIDAVEAEGRSLALPPPKLEYLQSEDGVEVFYGYSIVKHN